MRTDCMTLCVRAGVDLEAQDIGEMTPLLLAAHTGNDAVMKELLRLGAAFNVCDSDRTNVLGHACQSVGLLSSWIVTLHNT
jgi:ankyrin repeat protein